MGSKGERITAVIVSATGEWNAQGITPSGSFSLTTYCRYPNIEAFKADNGGRPVEPGTPIYRYDKAEYGKAVDHAYKGAMAEDSLPPCSMRTLLGETEPWDESKLTRGLDYVSRDVHILLAQRGGIPIELA